MPKPMLERDDILAFLRAQKALLFAEYRLSKIGLFGSFARGEGQPGSDIDILIEFQPGTEDLAGKKARLRAWMAKALGRDVDLCREKYIKPYIKSRILEQVMYV